MKKFWILGVISLALLGACGQEAERPPAAMAEAEPIEYYTCSMHPRVRREKPGSCPICGMDLVPVHVSSGSVHPQASPGAAGGGSGRGSVQLDEMRRQWIGLKVEPAVKRPLRRKISASARVASDPDLMVAQSDYLAARRTGDGELGGLQFGLVLAAKQRLRLLGMDESEIGALGRRGRPDLSLLLPVAGQPIWIYASVFESDLPWLRVGMGVEVELPGGEKRDLQVESISPVLEPATRTATLRIKLDPAPPNLRPGMFLPARLRAESGIALVVPSEALLDTGTEALVYVEAAPGSYEPRAVQVGRRGSGEVEILGGLTEGERVVTSGNFLVDSESRLRAASHSRPSATLPLHEGGQEISPSSPQGEGRGFAQ